MGIRTDEPEVVDAGLFWQGVPGYINEHYVMQRHTNKISFIRYEFRIITSGLKGRKRLKATGHSMDEMKGYWDTFMKQVGDY